MTDVKLPSVRKEEARASLRNHVIPHLNKEGRKTLEKFLANPVLEPGQTFEDVAFDITDSKHVTRSFKEGEVIAITALLECSGNSRVFLKPPQMSIRWEQGGGQQCRVGIPMVHTRKTTRYYANGPCYRRPRKSATHGTQ